MKISTTKLGALSILPLVILLLSAGCTTDASPDPDPGATLVVRLVNAQGLPQKSDTLLWAISPADADTMIWGDFVRRAADGSRWAYYGELPGPGLFTLEATYWFASGEIEAKAPTDCGWHAFGRRFIPTDSLKREMTLEMRVGMACQ